MHLRHLTIGESFYRPKSDLMHLFLGATSRRISIAFLSIFSAVYVFNVTSEFFGSTRAAILCVASFYILLHAFKLVGYLVAEDLSRKVGFKHVVWWSVLPFTVFVILLALSASVPVLVFLAPVFWGVHAGFYWWGFHGYFIKSGDLDHYGEGIGEEQFLEAAVGIFVPIAGAFIVDLLGFNVLFFVSYGFLILAVLLLGFKKDKKQKHDVRVKDVLAKMRKHRKSSLAFIGYSVDLAVFTSLWPLFLFLFFGQVLSLGIVISVGTLIAAIFTILVGKWFDRGAGTSPIRIGSPLLSLAWMFRFFSGSLPLFVLADTVTLFSSKLVNVPLDAISYKKGSESHAARAILFREISVVAGAIISFIVLAGIIVLGGSLKLVFLFAAFGSIIPAIVFMRSNKDGK